MPASVVCDELISSFQTVSLIHDRDFCLQFLVVMQIHCQADTLEMHFQLSDNKCPWASFMNLNHAFDLHVMGVQWFTDVE